MKIVQITNQPASFFFVPETEVDRLYVRCLQKSLEGAVEVHRLLEDEAYDKLVYEVAMARLRAENAFSKIEEYIPCPNCRDEFDLGRPGCEQHKEAFLHVAQESVVEIKLKVPQCSCHLSAGARGIEWDEEKGHAKDCVIPKARELGLVEKRP